MTLSREANDKQAKMLKTILQWLKSGVEDDNSRSCLSKQAFCRQRTLFSEITILMNRV